MTKLTELEHGVLKGLSAESVKKIRSANVLTVEDLAIQMPKVLAERSGLGKDTAVKAIDLALSFTRSGLITGQTFILNS